MKINRIVHTAFIPASMLFPVVTWAAGASNGSELSQAAITLGGGVSSSPNSSTSTTALGQFTAGEMAAPNGSESIITIFEGGGGIAVGMGAASAAILIVLGVALARVATRKLQSNSST